MEKLLGSNAVGELYRASMELEGSTSESPKRRVVAFRIFDHSLSRNPRLVKRFLQEAEKLQNINHPNIVPVLECGRAKDDTPYIARDFIEGVTLAEILERGPMDYYRAIEIIRGVALALQEAAKHELLHRNLNPNSVVIDDNARAQVLDFGQSKGVPSENSDTMGLTHYEAHSQDMRYLSPEQITDKRLDVRSDLYSLGCIAYYLFTGEVIFRGLSGYSVFNVKTLNKYDTEAFHDIKFKGPDKAREQAVKNAAVLVGNLVRANEEERYQSVEALLSDLDKAAENRVLKPLLTKGGASVYSASGRKVVPIFSVGTILIIGMGVIIFGAQAFLFLQSKPMKSEPALNSEQIEPLNPSTFDPTAVTEPFTFEGLQKDLPGLWRYAWGRKRGVMRVDTVQFLENKTCFAGLLLMGTRVLPVSGEVTTDDGKMSIYVLNAEESQLSQSELCRTVGDTRHLIVRSPDKLGFFAEKIDEVMQAHPPEQLQQYRINAHIQEAVEGAWHLNQPRNGLPEKFFLHSCAGDAGIFEMRDTEGGDKPVMGNHVIGLVTCVADYLSFSYKGQRTMAELGNYGGNLEIFDGLPSQDRTEPFAKKYR